MKQNIEKLSKSIHQKHYANYNNKYYKKIINASLEFPQSFTMPIYVRYKSDSTQHQIRFTFEGSFEVNSASAF